MKRTASDYWPLYHDDFWDDPEVLALSEREQLAYLFLLGLQWKHGSLPGSDAQLALMCRRFRGWPKLWQTLAKFFPSCTDGTRSNNRLAFELEEIENRRAKSSDRKARWRTKKQGLSTSPSHGTETQGNAARRGEEKKREETRGEEKPPRARRTRDKPAVTHDRRLVSDYWCGAFQRAREAPYAWEGGKDGDALTRVLKAAGGDVAEVQRRIDKFLADGFWSGKADFGKFVSQWNAMAGEATTGTRSILEIIANAGNGEHR